MTEDHSADTITAMDTSTSNKLSLLTLPREIRDLIYDALLPEGDCVSINGPTRGRQAHIFLRNGHAEENIGANLLQCCSQLHDEFLERIYSCVFLIKLYDNPAHSSFDLDRELPRGPIRSRILHLGLAIQIGQAPVPSLFASVPKLTPLKDMSSLLALGFSVRMCDKSIQTQQALNISPQVLSESATLNGLIAHIVGFIPASVQTLAFRTMPSYILGNWGCVGVDFAVLDSLFEKYAELDRKV